MCMAYTTAYVVRPSSREILTQASWAYVPCMLLSAVIAIPVVLVLLFVVVLWLPDLLLHTAEEALGPRVINSLFGIAGVVAGVLLGARLWYVTSTRGRQVG